MKTIVRLKYFVHGCSARTLKQFIHGICFKYNNREAHANRGTIRS